MAPAQPNWFTEAPPSDLIFLGRIAIAFNSDGTRNSGQNPARPGSTMTLFVAGAGKTQDALQDGAIGVPGQGTPSLPLQLTINVGPQTATPQILYAGSLSQTANAVVQINIRLPDLDIPTVRDAQLILKVGEASAPPAVIFISK